MIDAYQRIAFLEAELGTLRAITPSDRRIAEAPRAWAVYYSGEFIETFPDIQSANKKAFKRHRGRVVPVAIVELKEGE